MSSAIDSVVPSNLLPPTLFGLAWPVHFGERERKWEREMTCCVLWMWVSTQIKYLVWWSCMTCFVPLLLFMSSVRPGLLAFRLCSSSITPPHITTTRTHTYPIIPLSTWTLFAPTCLFGQYGLVKSRKFPKTLIINRHGRSEGRGNEEGRSKNQVGF